jgi:hypothetical protein
MKASFPGKAFDRALPKSLLRRRLRENAHPARKLGSLVNPHQLAILSAAPAFSQGFEVTALAGLHHAGRSPARHENAQRPEARRQLHLGGRAWGGSFAVSRRRGVLGARGQRSMLWRMVRAGSFPPRVSISARAAGHVYEDVEAWMAARATAPGTGDDPGDSNDSGSRLSGTSPSGAATLHETPQERRRADAVPSPEGPGIVGRRQGRAQEFRHRLEGAREGPTSSAGGRPFSV